jgi:hypothetical protein
MLTPYGHHLMHGRPARRRYPDRVTSSPDFEARLAAVETRVEQIAAEAAAAVSDAAAARHLAAARDRDLADLTVKVDANRSAINALGVQTASRFERLEQHVDAGFAEMRARFDQTAAGMAQIVDLLTRRDDQ